MVFNTKYNHNDMVYHIGCRRILKEIPCDCSLCDSTGKVKIKGIDYTCPQCNGRKERAGDHIKWYIAGSGRIGKIDIENYASKYQRDNDSRIAYMLDSTGVGGGTIHREDELFATKEKAQEECDYRTENNIRPTWMPDDND